MHPDQFQDEERQKAAHARMVHLNQAYREALRLAQSRTAGSYRESIDCEEAVKLAYKMLKMKKPESALTQLSRAESHSADWYHAQGRIMMEMGQYDTAEQSFRTSVRMEPDNIEHRRWALDARTEARKAKTFSGRLRRMIFGKRPRRRS